jgi:hypothetical protein
MAAAPEAAVPLRLSQAPVVPLVADFDWRRPDYGRVLAVRARRLLEIRRRKLAPMLRHFYAQNPIQFVVDWGVTFDPRNVALGLPATFPLVPFPRQVEWMRWALERWEMGERGESDKSRGSGVSWLAVSLSCALALFHDGFVAGFGSRKEEYVDKQGDPKSLFFKARLFLDFVPTEFRGGFDKDKHAPHMRVLVPERGSALTGEAGDSIGRGDRTALYFVDEAAFLEHPLVAEGSLSDTTFCRIDISTPGTEWGVFADKVATLPRRQVFTFHWRDDPRRDEAWYAKKVADEGQEVVDREYNCNHRGSVAYGVIPAAWAEAAVGAHLKLGIDPTGLCCGALDVADQGKDLNAFAGRRGVLLERLEEWSGAGSDTGYTTQRAMELCDEMGYLGFDYDADGLGSSCRSDARVLNDARALAAARQVQDQPFHGSGAVLDPEGEMETGRLNKNHFANFKAQSWWALRLRFRETFRALNGEPYDPDATISIDPGLPLLSKLLVELAQPTYKLTQAGKKLVDKAPDGTRSPNLADAVMIAFNPSTRWADMWTRLAG